MLVRALSFSAHLSRFMGEWSSSPVEGVDGKGWELTDESALNETQPAASSGYSLRSILLLALLVVVGAGATAYVVGSAFAVATIRVQQERRSRAQLHRAQRLWLTTVR